MSNANHQKLKKKAAEFEQKKQFDKALQLYVQFIDEAGRDLDDADLQLYNRVGDLLARQGNTSESLAYYEKAVDMYAERGFLSNAIALCNKILRQSPARSAVYYKLGKISANKGFKSDARKNFLEYADRMQKAGQRDEAFRALKELADLCPDQEDIRLMLADLLARDERKGEAIEQLEHLYAKLEAEGREAEARATRDRIAAIDPEITPRASGVYQAQKNNDLVFLDLGEPAAPIARAVTPLNPTPVPDVPAQPAIDVSGVGALAGLNITFLPDLESAEVTPPDEPVAALDGLDTVAADLGDVAAVPVMDGLEPDMTTLEADEGPAVIADRVEDWPHPEAPVAHPEGWANEVAPEPGELLDEAALNSALADAVGANGPDLTFVTSPEDIGPLLEETPDAWVAAALGAPRDDDYMDRLLTPLDVPAITEAAPLPELSLPEPAADGTAGLVPGQFSVDELLQLPAPVLPEFALDELGVDEALAGDPGEEVAEVAPLALHAGADSLLEEVVQEQPATGDIFAMGEPLDEDPVESEEAASADPVAADTTIEVSATTDPSIEFLAVEETPAPIAAFSPYAEDAAALPPEFDAEDRLAELVGQDGALDLSSVREALHEQAAWSTSAETPPSVEPVEMETVADGEAVEDTPVSGANPTYSDDRVELPLIDLENAPDQEVEAFHVEGETIDDLLSAAPSFGHDTPVSFEPEPLDLGEDPPATTEEWNTPEVLIDGEWRDEHVGGLVSGEMFVVGDRRPVDQPAQPPEAFDDLTAAMLYDSSDDHRRMPTPASPESFAVRPYTPRHSVSFGGLEAQLRRRLELDPNDAGLRRQLGEALLDLGEREEGLVELEAAIREYELRGDLGGARDVTDVILRIVPLSVRHHQKRVEYAARTNDRPLLVEAYTELGDALFRCGEPDKARVVYTRVLDLAPSNERARFALSMLSEQPLLPRSSDEIPSIDTGILSGTPSVTLVTLTPDTLDVVPAEPAGELVFIDAGAPPAVGTSAQPSMASADPEIDDEVDAAFADETAQQKEVERRTSELEAIQEWAAEQPVSLAPAAPADTPPQGDFVDLGEWLRGDEAPRSTRMVANDVAPTGDEQADFNEMLRRFKQGVSESVEDEDYASHYDLGVAFKEMGLLDEAIGQFQKALRGQDHRVRSYEALGQCFVERGQFEVARALLTRALEIPGADDLTLVGVLYLLGLACDRAGRKADAVGYYQRVFAVDIAFRDVADRLSVLDHRTP